MSCTFWLRRKKQAAMRERERVKDVVPKVEPVAETKTAVAAKAETPARPIKKVVKSDDSTTD